MNAGVKEISQPAGNNRVVQCRASLPMQYGFIRIDYWTCIYEIVWSPMLLRTMSVNMNIFHSASVPKGFWNNPISQIENTLNSEWREHLPVEVLCTTLLQDYSHVVPGRNWICLSRWRIMFFILDSGWPAQNNSWFSELYTLSLCHDCRMNPWIWMNYNSHYFFYAGTFLNSVGPGPGGNLQWVNYIHQFENTLCNLDKKHFCCSEWTFINPVVGPGGNQWWVSYIFQSENTLYNLEKYI